MLRTLFAALALMSAGVTGAYARGTGGSQPVAEPDPLAGLSAAKLAGARVIAAYSGSKPPAALRRGIANGTLGGVIVFRENIPTRAALRNAMASLQQIRRPKGLRTPLLMMIDQEGGVVKRLDGAPSRSPAQLGAIDDTDVTRREGLRTAANLRSVGVNVNLAPVVDLGRPGAFQRKTGRAYGASPALVGRHGVAFVKGLAAGGVIGCLKHFAGLGSVPNDEDVRIQTIALPLDRLRNEDEAPFATAIAAGAKLVMTSTGIYPPLDRSTPAMLSRRIVLGELRGQLGFKGLTITDSLDVAALTASPERLALQSVRAGEDILLYTSLDSALRSSRAIAAAYRKGTVNRNEFRRATKRVLALRAEIVP